MPRATTRLHELALACVIAAVVFGCGDDPAGSGDAGFADDVVNYDCEFEADAATSPGMPCTTQCGDGIWTCSEDAVVCSERFNACGGCGRLDHEVGDPCGDGGTWECAGTNAVECDGDRSRNQCGGTAELEGEPGESCGDERYWVCDGRDAVVCESFEPNACGGRAVLEGEPRARCGPGRVWVCDGPDAVECLVRNACGGTTELEGVPGHECGNRGEWVCDGTESVRCHGERTDACALAEFPTVADPVLPSGPVPDPGDPFEGVNACGGSEWLTWEGRIHERWDVCGCGGRLDCETQNTLACEDEGAGNECGGCLPVLTAFHLDVGEDRCWPGVSVPGERGVCVGPHAGMCESPRGLHCGPGGEAPYTDDDHELPPGCFAPRAGDACGECGIVACDWMGESLYCELPFGNVCGGCEPLAFEGDLLDSLNCGSCGTVECLGANEMRCVDQHPLNECGTCADLTWNEAPAAPGDPCEGPCGPGVLECGSDGQSLSCSSRLNQCGGCEELEMPDDSRIGYRCGDCGSWECDGPDRAFCDDHPFNACGGCDELSWPRGEECSSGACEVGGACGRCGFGTFTCRRANTVTCVGDITNECGGCGEVTFRGEPAASGDACWDTCVEGTLRCDWYDPDDNRLSCAAYGDNPRLDLPCGDCGVYSCVDHTEEVCVGDAACDPVDVLRPTDGGRTEEPVRGTFGRHLLLDGDDLLVAADRAADPGLESAGRVWHRRWNGTDWDVVGVIHPPERHYGQRFGNAMDLDGDWLAIAARNDDREAYRAGAVYLFERDGLGWAHRQTLVAPDSRENGAFGWDVALSGDHLLVTAWEDDTRTGHGGWLFERADATRWTLSERFDLEGTGYAGDIAEGLVVLVDYDAARASAFVRTDEGWQAGPAFPRVQYTPSFNIWTDGRWVVAAPRTHPALFTFDTNVPEDETALLAERSPANWLYRRNESGADMEIPRVAYSIAGHGDLLLTGAPRASWRDSAEPSGAAVLWQQDPATGGWTHLRTFDSPGDFPHGNFGHAVDINDRWIAVGEPSAEYDGYEAGAVYVFARD